MSLSIRAYHKFIVIYHVGHIFEKQGDKVIGSALMFVCVFLREEWPKQDSTRKLINTQLQFGRK